MPNEFVTILVTQEDPGDLNRPLDTLLIVNKRGHICRVMEADRKSMARYVSKYDPEKWLLEPWHPGEEQEILVSVGDYGTEVGRNGDLGARKDAWKSLTDSFHNEDTKAFEQAHPEPTAWFLNLFRYAKMSVSTTDSHVLEFEGVIFADDEQIDKARFDVQDGVVVLIRNGVKTLFLNVQIEHEQ